MNQAYYVGLHIAKNIFQVFAATEEQRRQLPCSELWPKASAEFDTVRDIWFEISLLLTFFTDF
jgi:hypothetical protein